MKKFLLIFLLIFLFTSLIFTDSQVATASNTNSALAFVFTGESNAGGIATNSDAAPDELAPIPQVQILNNNTFKFENLDIGTNNNIDHYNMQCCDTHGFELQLANSVKTHAFANYPQVYLVKTGQGDSILSDWNVGGIYWTKFLQRINAAKTQLPASTQWVVWYSLGINDYVAGTPTNTFKSLTIAHLNKIKAELPGAIIIMTQFQSMTILPTVYDTAMTEITSTLPNVYVVNSTGSALTAEGLHWNYTGFNTLVPRMVAITNNALGLITPSPTSFPTPTITSTANPFGILTWGDSDQTKTQIAENLGVKYYRPLSIFLNNWQGSCAECDAAVNAGLKLILTIRNNGGSGQFTTPPTDINAFKQTLGPIVDKYKPEILVIENEENSDLFYTGSPEQYLAELKAGCEIAHSYQQKVIKCTNGGLVSKLVVVLVSQSYEPDANKADDYLKRALTPSDYNTISSSINSSQWQDQITRGKALLAGYKTSGADFVNFHWHQENAETIPEAVTYLGSASQALPVINNEISPQESINPNQVTSFMQQALGLNLPYVVWYSNDGDGIGGPTALTDKAGIMNDSGRAYQQFIKDHFLPTPTHLILNHDTKKTIFAFNNLIPGSGNSGSFSADLDSNGKVDIADYNFLVSDFGKTGMPGFIPADINKDGKVDIYDYNILINNFK